MKIFPFLLFCLFATKLQAQTATKVFTDSLGEISVQLPDNWLVIRNLYANEHYKNCLQSSLFVTLDGMNTAITDFSAGCVISKDADVSQDDSQNWTTIKLIDSKEQPQKHKKTKNPPYHPKKFLKNSHQEYVAVFKQDYNNKDLNFQAIKNTKITIGNYKGLFSEFMYDHDNVEFTGRYHTYLISVMEGNKRVQILMEADITKWAEYQAVFDAALKNLQLK